MKHSLEDWRMHLQRTKIGRFAFRDEILFSYRWHPTNAIRTTRFREDNLETLLLEKSNCDRHGLGKTKRRAWFTRVRPWTRCRKKVIVVKRRGGRWHVRLFGIRLR